MIKTLLINPITKETTEAFVDIRSLEQLYEFDGAGTFSIPLLLSNGDSLIWNIDNRKKNINYLDKIKSKFFKIFNSLLSMDRILVFLTFLLLLKIL